MAEPPAKVQRTGGDSALDAPDAAPSPGKEGAGLIARKKLEEEHRAARQCFLGARRGAAERRRLVQF